MRSAGSASPLIRLPPTNHGKGDQGFIAMMVSAAREKGESVYVGGGENRWPAVHRLDTATVYRLALEKGASAAVYHAVAEEGVQLKDVATAIGKKLGVPVASKSAEEAQQLYGFVGMVVPIDNPTSGAKTRERLGWNPVHPSLLADIESGVYSEQ